MGERTLQQILGLSPAQRKSEYKAINIGDVVINNRTFTNYGNYSFIWEKSYVKSPERSGNGSIGNLNSYATFLTGHLKIDYSVMSIDDYRALMKMIYERNEFVVECYDVVWNKTIKLKMYFSTEEMPKLYTISHKRQTSEEEWEEWVDLVGVQGYTVEMIGTNNNLDLVSVMYYPNYPADVTSKPFPNYQAEEDVYIGEEIIIGANSTYQNDHPIVQVDPNEKEPKSYKFSHWEDENGEMYTDGAVITVYRDLKLYAVWQVSTENTLSFSYGISTPVYDGTVEQDKLYNRTVQYGISIGSLPKFNPAPSVKYNDKEYKDEESPYENGAWYRLPVKDENVRLYDDDLYWSIRDSIIYLLFDKKKYPVVYNTNSDITIPTQEIEYGATITLPVLASLTKSFDGWYFDSAFTQRASGTMPPYEITLYAKWTDKK